MLALHSRGGSYASYGCYARYIALYSNPRTSRCVFVSPGIPRHPPIPVCSLRSASLAITDILAQVSLALSPFVEITTSGSGQ